LGQVEGRSAKAVKAWLESQPQRWRDQITHVTIDLSASYAKAIREGLPGARIVADRFHLVKLGNDMVTAVRARVTRETRDRRGRKIDPEWRSRRRLLMAGERLDPATLEHLTAALADIDQGDQILMAWAIKEDLRSLLKLAGTNPSRMEIRGRLAIFYDRVAASGIPEAARLAKTVQQWWPAIEAGLITGYSNARSEGYNRVAKHVARNAYGYRNTSNQRRAVRWACTRQYRRETARITGLPG